jgi:hypothetical protein
LVKNGIPLEVAFSLDDEKRAAMSIVFSEFEGTPFNWNTLEFEKP